MRTTRIKSLPFLQLRQPRHQDTTMVVRLVRKMTTDDGHGTHSKTLYYPPQSDQYKAASQNSHSGSAGTCIGFVAGTKTYLYTGTRVSAQSRKSMVDDLHEDSRAPSKEPPRAVRPLPMSDLAAEDHQSSRYLRSLPQSELIHNLDGLERHSQGLLPATLAPLHVPPKVHVPIEDFRTVNHDKTYQDRTQVKSATEILNQASYAAEYNRQLKATRQDRMRYLDNYWTGSPQDTDGAARIVEIRPERTTPTLSKKDEVVTGSNGRTRVYRDIGRRSSHKHKIGHSKQPELSSSQPHLAQGLPQHATFTATKPSSGPHYAVLPNHKREEQHWNHIAITEQKGVAETYLLANALQLERKRNSDDRCLANAFRCL
jgi:hypothetical protein